MTTHAEGDPLTGPLLRSAVRAAGVRCAVLGAISTASTAAALLLPAVLGRTLDRLLAHAPAARWVWGARGSCC